VARNEAEFVATASSRVSGIAVAPANPGTVEVKTLQRPFLGDRTEKWFEKMLSGPTADNVRAWVNTGIQQGLTTDEIVRGLRGTKQQTGILSDKPRHAVAALVRTAATHASTVGRQEGFKALGVTHYRFVATLDSLTSVQCAANDGKVFEMGKGPVPPLHPNCRSVTEPVWDPAEKPDGDRASIDGPVPADQSFEDWLGQQSKKDQNEALGKTKAEAWRSGKLPLAKMLGADLQPLTLAELRELDRI
jgi:SPP1 gp7 family putative phage head morphogenesis protein